MGIDWATFSQSPDVSSECDWNRLERSPGVFMPSFPSQAQGVTKFWQHFANSVSTFLAKFGLFSAVSAQVFLIFCKYMWILRNFWRSTKQASWIFKL
jgi:hypothetical protein